MSLGDVLFATNFSTASERAGIVAKGLAQQWGSRLHIVHVVHPLTDHGDVADRLKRLVAEADERLRVETALLGSVAESVVRLAPCHVLTVPATAVEADHHVPAEPTAPHRCIVCVSQTEDLIYETCGTRIRAEALERKRGEERPGRRGAPV